jgi:hypothetical protein
MYPTKMHRVIRALVSVALVASSALKKEKKQSSTKKSENKVKLNHHPHYLLVCVL